MPYAKRWHTASFVELVVILVVKGLLVVVAAVEVVVVLLVLVDGGCAPLCSSAGDDTPALAAPGAPSTQTSKSSWPAAPLTTLPHRTALQQSAAWVCRLLGRSAEQCAQLTRTSHERPPWCRLQPNCTN